MPPPAATVVVVNQRYLSAHSGDAAEVGATSFTHQVLRALGGHCSLGIILYRRDDLLNIPTIQLQSLGKHKAVVLGFNFRMPAEVVTDALGMAISRLTLGSAVTPVVYYQSDVLVHYHPPGLLGAITHHGPFVDHFEEHFSSPAAVRAFGGATKLEHLRRYQRMALARLIQDQNLVAITHSAVQRSELRRQGVPTARLLQVTPPIERAVSPSPATGRRNSTGPPVAFTAVARIDHFKNLELFVDAGVILLKQGMRIRFEVVGGREHDHAEVEALRKRVPTVYQQAFTFAPRVSKVELYELFRRRRHDGVFVCPSRYETLGITPLEAAAHGVATLIVNSPFVEASRYLPERARFEPTAGHLADRLEMIHATSPRQHGRRVRRHVRHHLGPERFAADLRHAWHVIATLGPTS